MSRLMTKKFHLTSDAVAETLQKLRLEDLSEFGEYLLDCDSVNELQAWIRTRQQGNLSEISADE